MVATTVLVMTGLVAGLLLVGLVLIRRSMVSATPNANRSGSGGDSSWLHSGSSGSESGHGGGSDCEPGDSGTSDAGCDSGSSDGGGGDGGGGGSD